MEGMVEVVLIMVKTEYLVWTSLTNPSSFPHSPQKQELKQAPFGFKKHGIDKHTGVL